MREQRRASCITTGTFAYQLTVSDLIKGSDSVTYDLMIKAIIKSFSMNRHGISVKLGEWQVCLLGPTT